MTTTLPTLADYRPLRAVIPDYSDLEAWTWMWSALASDTAEVVHHYRHQRTGRWLRLDRRCRVYVQDPHGQVRLFGRGGSLALSVALNMVFDGFDEHRPGRVLLTRSARRAERTS